MNWRLERACSLTVRNGANAIAVVKVCLISDIVDRLCIGLCLLKEGLIDSLDLIDTNGADLFRLQRSTHAVSIQLGKGRTILALNTIELERWVHFALRTVRDGVAEVDHLDVEVLAGQAHKPIDVVIVFPSSVPPVSSDEARRRLGLL